MTVYIHTCERCGKEKEMFLNEGDNPADLMCGCGKKKGSTDQGAYIGIESISHKADSSKKSGCCGGGHCGN